MKLDVSRDIARSPRLEKHRHADQGVARREVVATSETDPGSILGIGADKLRISQGDVRAPSNSLKIGAYVAGNKIPVVIRSCGFGSAIDDDSKGLTGSFSKCSEVEKRT